MRATIAVLVAGLLAGPPVAANAAPAAPAAARPSAKPSAAKPAPKATAGPAPTAAPKAAATATAAAKPAPRPMIGHSVMPQPHHTVLANVHYRLKNGLQVILYEDPSQPQVRVSVWYHSGSCNEHPGLHGMAHLFEHLMFEGSAHMGQSVLAATASRAPGDGQAGPGVRGASKIYGAGDMYHVHVNVFTYLAMAGATGLDAETSYEHTRFFETMPPENLRVALWLESDRMGFLDAFKMKKLNKQRHIVDNELRQRIKTVPYVGAEIKMWKALWPKPHPCHDSPAGSIEDLTHVTLKDMRAYYEPAYAPADATLVLAGDLPRDTKKLVAKYFGTLPARTPMPKIHYKPVHLTHQIVVNATDQLARMPMVTLAWHAPPILTQGDAVAQLAAEILSGSPEARLNRAMRRQHLALGIEAGLDEHGFGSVFEIRAEPRPGVSLNELVAGIDKVVRSLKSPPPMGELIRARRRIETERLTQLQGLTAKAALLQTYAQFGDDPDGFYADLSRYEKVTPKDIADYVTKHLATNERVELLVHPAHPLRLAAATPAAPAAKATTAADPKAGAAPKAEKTPKPAAATAKEAR